MVLDQLSFEAITEVEMQQATSFSIGSLQI
jgi:hypothetical protein